MILNFHDAKTHVQSDQRIALLAMIYHASLKIDIYLSARFNLHPSITVPNLHLGNPRLSGKVTRHLKTATTVTY